MRKSLINSAKNINIRFISILSFIIFISLSSNVVRAEFDPTICDQGDDTPWQGPKTVTGINILSFFGCENDIDCIIEVEYYIRWVDWGNGLEPDLQISNIKMTNCSPLCEQYIWKAALFLAFMANESSITYYGDPPCYQNYFYQASTCWEKLLIPTMFEYRACGAECCVGNYKVCKVISTNGNNYTFELLGRTTPETYNCTAPCSIVDCENSTPNTFQVNDVPINTGGRIIIPPKMSYIESNFAYMQIFPNPAQNTVTLELTNEYRGEIKIELTDILGNSIMEIIDNKSTADYIKQIDVKNLQKGLINIKVNYGNHTIKTLNFIKID